MIKTFLKAKHWQIFSLLIVPIILFQVYLTMQLSSVARNDSPKDMENFFSVMGYFPIMMLIITGVFYGWLWSISIGLGKRLSEEIKLNTKWFKICFFFQAIYLLLIIGFVGLLINGVQTMIASMVDFTIILIILPLHLIAIACSIYVLYFTAKTIKTAELKCHLKFNQFVGEFFLLWFFPIGVWIVQPTINRLAAEEEEWV